MKDAKKYQDELVAVTNIFKKAGVFNALDRLTYLSDKTYEQVLADITAQYRRTQFLDKLQK